MVPVMKGRDLGCPCAIAREESLSLFAGDFVSFTECLNKIFLSYRWRGMLVPPPISRLCRAVYSGSIQPVQYLVSNLFRKCPEAGPFSAYQIEDRPGSLFVFLKHFNGMIPADLSGAAFRNRQRADSGKLEYDLFPCDVQTWEDLRHHIQDIVDLIFGANA